MYFKNIILFNRQKVSVVYDKLYYFNQFSYLFKIPSIVIHYVVYVLNSVNLYQFKYEKNK